MTTKTFVSKLLIALHCQAQPQGFTLPGFLIRVFLYSSVLTTLMVPFMNFDPQCFLCFPANKRKPYGEAHTRSINRAQQAYYLENGKFTLDFPQLDLGIAQDTGNYSYRILTPMESQKLASQDDLQQVITIAQAKEGGLDSYFGSVVAIPNPDSSSISIDVEEHKTIEVLCRIKPHQPLPTTMPEIFSNELVCPQGYERIIYWPKDGIF